jgi:pyruvate/2-oxoglutarate dehydrogenase complex dihydrolipoamide acyltransferase (E2) component
VSVETSRSLFASLTILAHDSSSFVQFSAEALAAALAAAEPPAPAPAPPAPVPAPAPDPTPDSAAGNNGTEWVETNAAAKGGEEVAEEAGEAGEGMGGPGPHEDQLVVLKDCFTLNIEQENEAVADVDGVMVQKVGNIMS